MIKEDYVSFEVAKLLKKKGFGIEEETHGYYPIKGDALGKLIFGAEYHHNTSQVQISAPTHQMAMKWLREVHHIHTEICLYKTSENDIEPKKSRKAPYYTFGVWDSVTGDNIDKRLINDFIGDTYEDACEAAIKYYLKNLI